MKISRIIRLLEAEAASVTILDPAAA